MQLLFFAGKTLAQSYNDGPIQLQMRVREVDVTLNSANDLTLNIASLLTSTALDEDEYTFKVWGQDNLNVSGWLGGNCMTDEFDPAVTGTSIDFNQTFFNYTYNTAVVPKFFQLRIDNHEDDVATDFANYGVVSSFTPCGNLTNYSRCNFDLGVCCINIPFFGCQYTENDDIHCNANPFKVGIDYRLGPPCQWYNHGFVAGGGCVDNVYQPRVESYWRYTKGTACNNAIDLGTLTSTNPLFHYNSNECYTNNWAASGGNDVFYQFTLTQPMGITASLCGTANFNTTLYILDANCQQIEFNDDYCNQTSSITAPLCTAGTYYVVVDGATAADFGTFTLNITPTPGVLLNVNAGADRLVCLGNNTILGANPAAQFGTAPYSYNWYAISGNNAVLSATNVANPVLTPTANDSYVLAVTDADGCTIRDTVNITVDIPPVAGINANTTLICTGTSANLSASGGISYQWQFNGGNIPGATSSTYNAVMQGNYTVIAFNSNGCPDTSALVFVQVVASAVANISSSSSPTFCQGQSVTLNGYGIGLNYQWLQNGNPIAGANSNNYLTSTSGNYQVVLSFNGQCSDTSGVMAVTVNPLPTTSISPTNVVSICQGNSQTFTAGGGATYQWYQNGIAVGGNSATYSANTTGNYYATVTNAAGCSANTAVSVLNILPNPISVITPNGNLAICSGDSIHLVGSGTGGGQTYQWLQNGNPISGSNTNTYTAFNAGNYQLSITENGCTTTSTTANVVVSPLPTPTLNYTGNQVVCGGTSLVLAANGGGTYQWIYNNLPIAGATNTTLTATQAGTYNVIATNSANCSAASTTTTLSFLPAVTASILPSGNVDVCDGESIDLTASGGNIVGWYQNNILIPNFTANVLPVTSAGNYSVAVQGVCNTDTSANTSVSVNALPTVSLNVTGTANICAGDSLLLAANVANFSIYSLFKDGQLIYSGTSNTYNLGAEGIYYVRITDSNGCQNNSNPLYINYLPLPDAQLNTRQATVFCQGKGAMLHASGGNTYTWLQNGQIILGATDTTYYATQTGAYNIIASNTCGNDTSGTLTLEASAPPIADFYTLEDKIYEESEMHFIDKSIDASAWMWQLADGSAPTFMQNPVHTYADSGVYAVTLIITDDLGCTDTLTKNIVIHAIPPFFIPNVFTPNGDGVHDKLEIEYGRLTDIELSIFDRWGNKLFSTANKLQLWDGNTQGGYEAEAGVYFYKVTAKDEAGISVHYEGNVTLVR